MTAVIQIFIYFFSIIEHPSIIEMKYRLQSGPESRVRKFQTTVSKLTATQHMIRKITRAGR